MPRSPSARGNGQSLSARLVVGADGRQSLCREAAGIDGQAPRPQSGRADLQHRPLAAASTISRRSFTPRKVRACSCRCPATAAAWCGSRRPKEAERLIALERRRTVRGRRTAIAFHSRPRQRRAGTASVSAGDRAARGNSPSHRIALVGEAAHVLPPIGAQGLNMGLRDAADIADIVRDAMLAGEDPGAPQVLERYAFGAAQPTSPAGPSRSTWRTARCSAISCRCSRCARPACI